MKLQVMCDLDMITKAVSLAVQLKKEMELWHLFIFSQLLQIPLAEFLRQEMPLPEPSYPFSVSFRVNLDHSCKSG